MGAMRDTCAYMLVFVAASLAGRRALLTLRAGQWHAHGEPAAPVRAGAALIARAAAAPPVASGTTRAGVGSSSLQVAAAGAVQDRAPERPGCGDPYSGRRRRRNVILGAAIGYPFHKLIPFLRSYVQSGTSMDADVVLIVGPEPSDKMRALCRKYGATLFVDGVNFTRSAVLLGHGMRKDHGILHHTSSLRYLLYDEVLARPHWRCYDKVVLCDTRDLYFQRDPFEFVLEGLYVSQEAASAALSRTCNHAGRGAGPDFWIHAYGRPAGISKNALQACLGTHYVCVIVCMASSRPPHKRSQREPPTPLHSLPRRLSTGRTRSAASSASRVRPNS